MTNYTINAEKFVLQLGLSVDAVGSAAWQKISGAGDWTPGNDDTEYVDDALQVISDNSELTVKIIPAGGWETEFRPTRIKIKYTST